MAAMLISKRVPVASLLEKLLSASASASPAMSPLRTAASVVPNSGRRYNTNTQLRERGYDNEVDDDAVGRGREDAVANRRGEGFPSLFADMFDPFVPPRTLSQVLNLMDQALVNSSNPFVAASRGAGAASGIHRSWDAREDKDALHLRVDMPGLGKEHVKVTAEKNTLIIQGEGEKEFEEEEAGRRYSSRIDLPLEFYRMDQIKAEMKNGVLKVVVPKVKEEDRKDVFQVNIE